MDIQCFTECRRGCADAMRRYSEDSCEEKPWCERTGRAIDEDLREKRGEQRDAQGRMNVRKKEKVEVYALMRGGPCEGNAVTCDLSD